MRVAIITAGLPRFTPDFLTVLSQLKGFDTADLYIAFWNTDWAKNREEAMTKVAKILPANIILKDLALYEQPSRMLPEHISANTELQWWYDRRIGQIHCLKLAMDLVDEPYDIVVRIRPDGSLSQDLDISTLDFTNNNILFCSNMMGKNQSEPNDQFLVGTQEGLKFFCDLYNNFDYWMLKTCPDWEHDVHEWALEHIIGRYYRDSGKSISRGDWTHDINRHGRSAYTADKHGHLSIAPDPTA